MTIPGLAVDALEGAKPEVFWSDRPDAPAGAPHLDRDVVCDLAVVGGGFTGLWTAIQALEEQPGIKVVLVEAVRCGFGASSRNGGFCDASLTHGLENGLAHWPDEIDSLLSLGRANLDAIEATLGDHEVDADFRRSPEIGVATEQWHLEELEVSAEAHRSHGESVELLNAAEMRDRVNSPTYLGGLARNEGTALVDPARLCWGLRAVAEKLGATIYENTPATSISKEGRDLVVQTPEGAIHADRVVMATNAYKGPDSKSRRFVIPVYDYVLMTEPLSAEQLVSVGWEGREGLGDVSNQFHYYRMTEDDRILWGGFDAIYHFNSALGSEHDQSDRTHNSLAAHFFDTFPQLEGLTFTHRWGGPIGTTTRFTPAWGRRHDDRMVWVAGYTGLGVGSSRFGARVALDLVFGRDTERTNLRMVRESPFPFPPEPLRWAGVGITRRAIKKADRREGRRGAWLSLLDRFGIGFDS